jgi:5'(3')-deoxyribonucleotidase
MEKKIIWLDMDGVLVDFNGHIKRVLNENPSLKEKYEGIEDEIPNIFRNPLPIKGAVEAVKKLEESGKYELYIATAAPWNNPSSASDKRLWVEEYFGELFTRKMAITHLKNMLIGDYLIDDRTKNGAGEFKGEHIHFGNNEFPNWESVLEKLL